MIESKELDFDTFVISKVKFASREIGRFYLDLRVIYGGEVRAIFLRFLLDDRPCDLVLAAEDYGCARLNNTRLFPSDFLDGVSENGNVILRYSRYQGEDRGADHVGGVKPASKSAFENNNVASSLSEVVEGDSGYQLKFRWLILHSLCYGAYPFGHFCEILIGNLLAVHPDSFVKSEDEWGSVKSNLIACRAKNRVEHRRGRALAVRSCDVDEFQLVLGISQRLAKGAYSRKSGVAKHRIDSVNKFKSLIVGHHFFYLQVFRALPKCCCF